MLIFKSIKEVPSTTIEKLSLSEFFYSLANIISGKYLILCFIFLIYISYYSLYDKILYSTYTSDNYNDYLLSYLLSSPTFNYAKFNLHFINNKILHPITVFVQNL